VLQLSHNIANPILEYDSITQSKQQPSRAKLVALRTQVDTHYNEYLNAFLNIHNKAPNPFAANDSTELRNCYNNSTAALDGLKARIVNAQTDTLKFICPYCLIINHTTFDHYIPKEEHPVYSVCSKNLIPCCGLCNGKKLQYWKENGQRAIIHFYNDTIPNQQFLYCDLTFNGLIPIVKFRLQFQNNFNVGLRYIIEKHFERLELLNRYDENVPTILSNIDTDFNSLAGFNPSQNEVADFLIRKANEYYAKYGRNYWQGVAYETLANSNQYLNNLTA
jgi:5-methylcytosine-specific restriction endonuclease McrA